MKKISFNLKTSLLAGLNHLRSYRFFWIAVAIGLVGAIGLRLLWASYGDHVLVSPGSLDVALGIVVLNFILALVALPREPYASTLLVGTALTLELLVMIFLYEV